MLMWRSILSSKYVSGKSRPSAKMRINILERSDIAWKYSFHDSLKSGICSDQRLGAKCGPAAGPVKYGSSGTTTGPIENDSLRSPGDFSPTLYERPSSP